MHPENKEPATVVAGLVFTIACLTTLWNILWTIPLALFGIEPILREAFGVDLSFPAVWFTLLTILTLINALRNLRHPRIEK